MYQPEVPSVQPRYDDASASSAGKAPTQGRHIPALDGLRGIAVLLVMLFHYEVRRWPWYGMIGRQAKYVVDFGWTGVDLFFVLSGFLITGILWETREKPRYFLNFYARRTLRIFPLYYAFLLVVFVLLPLLGGDSELLAATPLATQAWYWTYTSNVLIAVHGWAAAAALTPHFWSLAVEEQFYLVWPTVMRSIQWRRAVALCVAVIVAALLFRSWLFLARGNATAAWVLTPARMDSLAVGALLALIARGPRGLEPLLRWSSALLVLGIGAVVGLLVWRGTYASSDVGIGTIGYTIIALAWGTVLLASLAGGPLTRGLNNPVLRWVGRRSYALYVLHYPILVALERAGFAPSSLDFLGHRVVVHAVFVGVNAGLTALAAEASWRLMESRLLRLKKHFA